MQHLLEHQANQKYHSYIGRGEALIKVPLASILNMEIKAVFTWLNSAESSEGERGMKRESSVNNNHIPRIQHPSFRLYGHGAMNTSL